LWLVMAGEIAECTIRECGEEGRVLAVIGEEK
jgi:hypothetical protein